MHFDDGLYTRVTDLAHRAPAPRPSWSGWAPLRCGHR